MSRIPGKRPGKPASGEARDVVVEVLRIPREDQIALWAALQQRAAPTAAQLRLGRLIRSVM